MSLVKTAAAKTDQADLAILALVETIRDQDQPATSSAVASLIGGAPTSHVAKKLKAMWRLGLIEEQALIPPRYQLTELGVEVMREMMIGWSPSAREDMRRETERKIIRDDSYYSRLR